MQHTNKARWLFLPVSHLSLYDFLTCLLASSPSVSFLFPPLPLYLSVSHSQTHLFSLLLPPSPFVLRIYVLLSLSPFPPFLRALQLMPTQASLWVRAARYEFERNHHADAARVLFQQGLRFNRSSQLLWLEFLRMELQFSRTLLQRKRVLGLADKADKEKGKVC